MDAKTPHWSNEAKLHLIKKILDSDQSEDEFIKERLSSRQQEKTTSYLIRELLTKPRLPLNARVRFVHVFIYGPFEPCLSIVSICQPDKTIIGMDSWRSTSAYECHDRITNHLNAIKSLKYCENATFVVTVQLVGMRPEYITSFLMAKRTDVIVMDPVNDHIFPNPTIYDALWKTTNRHLCLGEVSIGKDMICTNPSQVLGQLVESSNAKEPRDEHLFVCLQRVIYASAEFVCSGRYDSCFM
jgi:hypothetical protein